MFASKRQSFNSERGAATSWLAGITSAALLIGTVALPAMADDGAAKEPTVTSETVEPSEAEAQAAAAADAETDAQAAADEAAEAEAVIGEPVEDVATGAFPPDGETPDSSGPPVEQFVPGIKVTTDDDSATIAWPEFGLDENYTVQQEKKDGTWKTLQAAAEPSETRDYEATINGLNVGKDYTLRIVTAETEALAESATEDAVDTSISGPALGSIARAAGNGSPDVVVSNAFTVVIAAAPSEAGDPLIPVRKYHDLNGNGIPNDGEPGLSGWTIFSDANSNSTLDDGETFTVTVDGGFGSLPLAWGDDYSICEVLQSGWVFTRDRPQEGALLGLRHRLRGDRADGGRAAGPGMVGCTRRAPEGRGFVWGHPCRVPPWVWTGKPCISGCQS